jgi:hypothetical protein
MANPRAGGFSPAPVPRSAATSTTVPPADRRPVSAYASRYPPHESASPATSSELAQPIDVLLMSQPTARPRSAGG